MRRSRAPATGASRGLKIFIALLVLVASLAPLGNSFTIEEGGKNMSRRGGMSSFIETLSSRMGRGATSRSVRRS